jgi:hypothetical protein
MSVGLSGEIIAIATSVLAIFAILTVVFALVAFRKQPQAAARGRHSEFGIRALGI